MTRESWGIVSAAGAAILIGAWVGKRAGGVPPAHAGKLYAVGAVMLVGGWAMWFSREGLEGPDGKLWLTVEDEQGNVAAGGDDEASPGNSDGLFPAWTHPDLWGVL